MGLPIIRMFQLPSRYSWLPICPWSPLRSCTRSALTRSPFSDKETPQNLLMLMPIRADKRKSIGFINKLDGYDTEEVLVYHSIRPVRGSFDDS